MGFPVMCSATLKVFLNMHIFLHLLYEFVLYAFSFSNHCHCCTYSVWWQMCKRKHSVSFDWLKAKPLWQCSAIAAMYVDETLLLVKRFNTGLSSFKESGCVEMHKSPGW